MKKEKVKKEKVELTPEEKKEKIRKIKLISLFILVSIIGSLFLATYLRWNADIEDKHRIIYYGQDDYNIKSLKDYYGADVSTDIGENEAIIMYCTKEYGQDCITADYNDWFENFLRDPVIIVHIAIILDLLIFYQLIKGKYMKDIKKLVMGIVIILYGCTLSFLQIYTIADYYIFANNKYKTTATIYKKVITDNKKSFHPIVKYEIYDEEYISYLDTAIKGDIEDKVGEEIDIHYYRKDKNNIVNKRFVLWRIIPFALGIVIIVEGTWYLPKYRIIGKEDENKKKDKKEKKK